MVYILCHLLLSANSLLSRYIAGNEVCWVCVSVTITPSWRNQGGSVINATASADIVCPLWTRRGDSGACECGDNLGGVVNCDPSTLEVTILVCHCMTYSNVFNTTLVGHCIFNCLFLDYLYVGVDTCHSRNMHRRGQMCGRCEEGYAPPVYSYSLSCVECSDYNYNWLKYAAAAFLPLTGFYILVVIFRISVTSEAMSAYVLVSQIIAAPVHLRLLAIEEGSAKLPELYFKAFSSVYMLWNLDIFRSLYTPICLHPNMSMLQALALEYATAVYPLLLIFITYFLVNLHDRFRVIVRLWAPFYRCFARLRTEWDIRSSLIEAFGTFILLSYVKILNISFDILTPTALYDVHGNRMPSLYLYYDGTYEYFGRNHMPYAFLALFMFLVFNVLPLALLCLYPCQCFQRCLNLCRLQRHKLNTFIDTFVGCYRTEPRDCRYFAAFYLVLRIINLALFSITTSPLYYPLGGIVFIIAAILVAAARPYKFSTTFIDIDKILFALLSAMSFGMLSFGYVALLDPDLVIKKWYRYAAIVLLFPPLYGGGLLIYRLLPKRFLLKLKTLAQHCKCNRHGRNSERVELLPDRLEHSDWYSPRIHVPLNWRNKDFYKAS